MSDINCTKKKAELITSGEIKIEKNIIFPFNLSHSTAGPDAGSKSIILSFNNTRVRLKINDYSKFSLVRNEKNIYQILKINEVFADNVKIIPTLLHAPNQAFINIEHRCIYNCKFCSSPKIKQKKRTKEEIIHKIIEASKDKTFEAVAITAGVTDSEEKTTNEIIEIINEIRKKIGNVIIGVEPCTTSNKDIENLKKAGAIEIKLNIQTFDKEIFKKICPQRDFDKIISSLEHSVKIFGKNNVCSNLIIGLGESDENVLEGVEYLAKIGVVSTLRAIRLDDFNKESLSKSLGFELKPVSANRLIKLAEKQKDILKKYELTTKSFKSMCHKCGSCDILPEVDI